MRIRASKEYMGKDKASVSGSFAMINKFIPVTPVTVQTYLRGKFKLIISNEFFYVLTTKLLNYLRVVQWPMSLPTPVARATIIFTVPFFVRMHITALTI